jgi:hypothetical protein
LVQITIQIVVKCFVKRVHLFTGDFSFSTWKHRLEDVLNLIDEMLDSHISEHTNDVLKQTVIEFNDTPVEDIAK